MAVKMMTMMTIATAITITTVLMSMSTLRSTLKTIGGDKDGSVVDISLSDSSLLGVAVVFGVVAIVIVVVCSS